MKNGPKSSSTRVEVEVVDHRRGRARSTDRPSPWSGCALLGAEHRRLLLRPPDEQDPLRPVVAGQELMQRRRLCVAPCEIDQRQPLRRRTKRWIAARTPRSSAPSAPTTRSETAVPGQEPDHLPDPLQLRDVEVEIEPVDRLELEHHMISQHIGGSAGSVITGSGRTGRKATHRQRRFIPGHSVTAPIRPEPHYTSRRAGAKPHWSVSRGS